MPASSLDPPLVSIIMPAHNAAVFIRETIESVQAQSWRHWELIIADDGSTDETVEVVDSLRSREPRIQLLKVSPPNGSAARARNHALAAAQGDFIAFLDADDLWESDKLAVQVDYLQNHPEADAVVCWYKMFGDEAFLSKDSRIQPANTICSLDEVVRGKAPALSSTLMMRRRCYEEIGGQDEDERLRNFGEDFVYYARLIAQFQVHRIRRVLTHYRIHPSGGSNMARALLGVQESRWRVFEVLRERGLLNPQQERQKRAHLYYETARDRLFYMEESPLSPLVKSLMTGSAPLKAWLLLLAAPLPPRAAISTLTKGQRVVRSVISHFRAESKRSEA